MREEINIRDLLESYARKIDYRLEDLIVAPKGEDPLTSVYMVGRAKNAFCQDDLSIYLREYNGIISLQHFGNYCSLGNAAAEIFCESLEGQRIDVLSDLLESISLYLSTSDEKCLLDKDEFYVLYELLKTPMSATRKRCVTLPCEAAIDALKTI